MNAVVTGHERGTRTASPGLANPSPSQGPSHGQRRSRQLSDKILLTFHAACDVRDFTVARQLLATLEGLLHRDESRSAGDQRRNTEALVAAYERLWHLTNGPTLS